MSHRTQITLSDAQYDHLIHESERSGVSLAELVRRAIDSSLGRGHKDPEASLANSFGAWQEHQVDGAEYVEVLRRGLARRLDR